MTNRMFAGLLIALMFFCLCVENKDDANKITTTTLGIEATTTTTAATTTTIISAGADNCVRFSCNGSIESRSEDNNLNVAYCEGKEIARIVCRPDEGANTDTGRSLNEYSMCCVKLSTTDLSIQTNTPIRTNPSIPTCDRCNDGTTCGSKSQGTRCSCRDLNNDGRFEVCISELSSGCEKCTDETACDQKNSKKELCKCVGQITHDSGANVYMDCSLTQLCDKCRDGTACGEKNNKSEMCDCAPIGESETCELNRPMTCEKRCQEIGYAKGYCGDWILNSDNTVSECNSGEYPIYPGYHPEISITDCVDNSAPEAAKKTMCCCKGEPVNSLNCPAIRRPVEPMDCIEDPGFLKDPKTGECCWYKATCYGPRDWQEYRTKEECINSKA